jgi:hypothetical protein
MTQSCGGSTTQPIQPYGSSTPGLFSLTSHLAQLVNRDVSTTCGSLVVFDLTDPLAVVAFERLLLHRKVYQLIFPVSISTTAS